MVKTVYFNTKTVFKLTLTSLAECVNVYRSTPIIWRTSEIGEFRCAIRWPIIIIFKQRRVLLLRWLENGVIKIGKTASTVLIFDFLKWYPSKIVCLTAGLCLYRLNKDEWVNEQSSAIYKSFNLPEDLKSGNTDAIIIIAMIRVQNGSARCQE